MKIDSKKEISVLKLKTHSFILHKMTLFADPEKFYINDPIFYNYRKVSFSNLYIL